MVEKRAGLLLHPGRVRLKRARHREHVSRGQMDKRRREDLPHPFERPDGLAEEVALPERLRVDLVEAAPSSLAPL